MAQLVPHALDVGGELAVAGHDSLADVSEGSTSDVAIIKDVGEENRSDVEVSDRKLVADKEIFAVREVLFEVSAHFLEAFFVPLLTLLVMLLLEKDDRNESRDEVIGVVCKSVCLPLLLVLGGVVSELLSDKAQDRQRLCERLTVLAPDGNLTIGQVVRVLCLVCGPILHLDSAVFVLSACVREGHASGLAPCLDIEIDKLHDTFGCNFIFQLFQV